MRAKTITIRTPASSGKNKTSDEPYWLIGPTGAPVASLHRNRHGSVLYINGQEVQVTKDIEEQLGAAYLGLHESRSESSR